MSSTSGGTASGSSGYRHASNKRQVWEDSPHTLTEFGALSSDMRPSGNFLTRLWKRNKENSSDQTNISPAGSVSALDSNSIENSTIKAQPSSGNTTVPAVAAEKTSSAPEGSGMTRPESLSSLQDSNNFTGSALSKLESSEEVLESQVSQRPQHRTLTSVLNRLGSILDQRSTTPQTYKDSDFKQYWMPDSSCRECYDCGDKFTTFRRRHHCRICGQIFCSKCCNQELSGKIIGYKGGIRVCTYCCHVVQRYAQQSTTTGDFRALEDLRAISQSGNLESGNFEFTQNPLSPRLSLGIEDLSTPVRGEQLPEISSVPELNTPFDLTPQSDFSSQESLLLESKLLIQDSVQLRELWHQICDLETGVETQTLRIRLRTYNNCIVGRELVDWLIKADKAATRDQAMAIGQALLYAGYLDCLGNQIPVFRDDFTLYRPGEAASSVDLLRVSESMPTIREEQERNEPLWFQEIEQKGHDSNSTNESPAPDSEAISIEVSGEECTLKSSQEEIRTDSRQRGSHGSSFSELPRMPNIMARDFEEPLPRQDSSFHGLGEDFLKGAVFLGRPQVTTTVACPTGWRNVDQLREENGERLAYERLKKAHTELWHVLTRQLLSHNSLLLSWENIISSVITQVSHFVRPDVRCEGDDMDIRNYVHIKKVPGGQKSETSLFHGVILTKNVAHKKMKTKITNPLILLLRGTIEFQRVENKFSSLEPQILQEREFMRHCVMKMVAYKPNVVVVEKSVSRLAQEFLLEAGITLLYNVKLSVMERLARFTQAHIVSSIDGLVSKPNMGFCHDFRVQTYTLPNRETKTLTFFDGCATHLGCTVLLSGGTFSELHRVKQIVKFMTYTAYNSLLELCFCMDEFALPQPGADEIGQPFEALESSLTSIVSDALTYSSTDSTSGTDRTSKDDHPFNWSIKAEELPGQDLTCSGKTEMSTNSERDEFAKTRAATEDDYIFEDGEDLEKSVDGNLLEGEDRQKALEMAGLREAVDAVKETAAPSEGRACTDDGADITMRRVKLDDARRHAKWYGHVVPSIEVSEMEENSHNADGRREDEEYRDTDSTGDVFEEALEQQTDDSSPEQQQKDCEITSNLDAGHFSKAGTTATSADSSQTVPSPPSPQPLTENLPFNLNNMQKSKDNASTQTDVKFGLSNHDFLPISEPKTRKVLRLSNRSLEGTADAGSDRSTPEIVSNDNPLWNGNPKLVGNIVCVIPKSAMPNVPVTSSTSSAAPAKEDSDNSSPKRKLKSVSALQNFNTDNAGRAVSLDENNLTKPSQIEFRVGNEEDVWQGTGPVVVDAVGSGSKKGTSEEIGRVISHDSSLTASQQSKGGLKVTLSRAISETSSSMSSKQSSTSKLTELTDGSDPLLGYQNTRDESIFHSDASRTLKEIKQTRYKLFRRALDGVHLTVSPYHKYHVPFIETDKGAKCSVRKYLPPNVFWSPLFDGESDSGVTSELSKLKKAAELEKKRDKVLGDSGLSAEVLGSGPSSKAMQPKSNIQLLHAHTLITASLTEPIWDLGTQSVLADFRARGGRIFVPELPNGKQARIMAESNIKKLEESTLIDTTSGKTGPLWAKRIDCLDVMNHQRLNVLFSSYSYKSNNHPFPCVYPWVVSMDFYGRNDITLGGFLERFCFRLQYSCPSPTCDTPMMDHIRRFVHGNACINVLLKHLDSEVPGARDNILMWSWCRKCKQVTPVVPISSDTWSLSFAKYLDLRFHASSFLRRATAEPCTHSLHHDHFQYFGHRNIVASFKYAPISLKELALPTTVVSLEPPMFDPELLADAVKMITYKAMDRYSLMLESTMKLKQEMTSEAQARTIGGFLAEQQADKKSFRDSATNIQMKIQELIFSVTCLIENGQTDSDMSCHLFSIFDNVELLKRHICADVLKWNNKMQEFMAMQQKKSRLQGLNKKDKETGLVLVDELEKSLRQGASKSGITSNSWTQPSSKSSATSSLTVSTETATGPTSSSETTTTNGFTAYATLAPSLSPNPSTTVTPGPVTSSVGSKGTKEESDSAVASSGKAESTATGVRDTDSAVSGSDGQDSTKSTGQSDSMATGVSHTSSPSPSAVSAASTDTKEGQTSDDASTAAQSPIPAVPRDEESTTSSSSSSTVGATTTAPVAGQPVQTSQVQSSQPASTVTEGQEETTDGWFQDLKGATRRWLSNSSFTPLPLPFDASEHHALPLCEKVPITVYDYEPSSIVAYTLSSSDYLCRLREIQNAIRLNSQPNSAGGSHQGRSRNKSGENSLMPGNPTDLAGESGKKAGVLSFLRGSSRETSPHSVSHSVPVQQHQSQQQQQQHAGKKYLSFDTVRYLPGGEGSLVNSGSGDDSILGLDDASPSPEEKPKIGGASTPSPHIEMQFSDSTAKFYCRVYFADQFRKLRKLLLPGGENRFIRSLSRCKPWEAKGGKSGSSFSKTDDDRFILKQMSNMEVDSFEKFGPQYFQYLKTCLSEEQPTALAKILGVFRIGFRNTQTNHALRQDVLVMENLFYNRRISQKFDLKGSMRNRMVNTSGKRGEEELVLLDENLLKYSVESPLYMRPHSKHVLRSAISSDSTFLSQNLVMDYSLLVGVDDATQELVVGIIDYIRTFTWDKKLEMVVKSSGILGGQGKMPTVVSPQLYKSRFLEAMDRYFLHVPDHWMGLGRDPSLRSTKIEQSEQKDPKKHTAYN